MCASLPRLRESLCGSAEVIIRRTAWRKSAEAAHLGGLTPRRLPDATPFADTPYLALAVTTGLGVSVTVVFSPARTITVPLTRSVRPSRITSAVNSYL